MTSMDDDDALRARQEAMTQALRNAFGERAREIARTQLELATDDAAVTWEMIVAALES